MHIGLEFLVQFRELLECFRSMTESHQAFFFSTETILFKLFTFICNITVFYIIKVNTFFDVRTLSHLTKFSEPLITSAQILITAVC